MKIDKKTIAKVTAFALITAGCVYLLRPGIAEYAEQRAEMKRLTAQIGELETDLAALEELKQKLDAEDPELTERLAREKFRLGKPGETIFRFKED